MTIVFDNINIVLSITAILVFILGLFIFGSGPKKKINVVYSAICVAVLGWIFGMMAYRSAPPAEDMFWCTILYIFPTFIPSIFIYFTHIFPKEDNYRLVAKRLVLIFLNLGIVLMVAMPGLIIDSVNVRLGQEKQIIFTQFYWFYFLYIFALFNYGFYRLISKIKVSAGVERQRILIVFLSYALAANVAFVTNLTMPWLGYFSLNWMGQVFSLAMVGFASYAILRYRFMDISFVVGRGFIYFSTYLTIIGSAFLLVFAHNYFGYSISSLYLWPALLVLGIICYQPLFAFYERIAEKYFYYTYHSYQKALSDLGRKANRFLELDKLSALLLDTICEIMHLDKAAIAIKNEKGGMAVIQSRGFEKAKLQYFLKGDFLETYLSECLNPVASDDIPELTVKAVNNDYEKNRFRDLGQEMKKAEINLCLPMAVEDKLSGVILLGNKNISDQFSEQDVALLDALAMHASIALQNAQYYSRIKSFGERLENSVRQKTGELREANERLKQLDKAKSEFISIASHQLRAPLTIIKGYLAVIRDGDYGKAPADAQARLATAYKANEQLITFTNDLLDMSRLENGKTVLKSEEIDLGAIVANAVLQLTPEAQKTGIALSFEKPSSKVLAKGDRQACEQAVYNVIANSMAHTPRGKVAVRLEEGKGTRKVLVQDNGEGFSREDLKNIFNKQPPASSEGIGLSLVSGIAMYLAKKMVEMQKGKIKVDSQGLGQGTEYSIELQAAQ